MSVADGATYGARTDPPGLVYYGRSSRNQPTREPMLYASRHSVPPRPLRAHPLSR
jgi:hypothetical protein